MKKGRRFRIAFSFAGEKREFVAQVAALLAGHFGEEKILYDKYHEAEFAQHRLGIDLPSLYVKNADLNFVLLCNRYKKKRWTGLEWEAIHSLFSGSNRKRVMLARFDQATIRGLNNDSGFVELDDKSPAEVATLILQRLAVNEDKHRDHYITDPEYWNIRHGPGISFDQRTNSYGDVLSPERVKEFQGMLRVVR
jgi:hypothetical protein